MAMSAQRTAGDSPVARVIARGAAVAGRAAAIVAMLRPPRGAAPPTAAG